MAYSSIDPVDRRRPMGRAVGLALALSVFAFDAAAQSGPLHGRWFGVWHSTPDRMQSVVLDFDARYAGFKFGPPANCGLVMRYIGASDQDGGLAYKLDARPGSLGMGYCERWIDQTVQLTSRDGELELHLPGVKSSPSGVVELRSDAAASEAAR